MTQVPKPPPLPMGFETDSLAKGRYEILRPLASGGMGNLYLARARGIEGFERLVVLKRLKPEMAAQQDRVKMFLDEVRVMASVQHPNVVHIYDVGVCKDGSYFYSMEFLVGQDLRRVMHRGARVGQPVPAPYALFITGSVLAGLHHVHQRVGPTGEPLQIVHRDVSPANVFVTYDGDVKLIDFGIATTRQRPKGPAQLMGKCRYMSPEQCRLEPVDARSDIFSLGIILWEMTTGRALYQGTDDQETLASISERDAPRPSSVVPGYPKDLEAVVMKALARRVKERWQSAREMLLAVEGLARRRQWPWSATCMAELMEVRFAPELAALRSAHQKGQDVSDAAARQAFDARPTPSGPSARREPLLPAIPVPATTEGPSAAGLVSTPPDAPPRPQPAPVSRRARVATAVGIMGLGFAVWGGLFVGLFAGRERQPDPLAAPVVETPLTPSYAETAPPSEPAPEQPPVSAAAPSTLPIDAEDPISLAPLPSLSTIEPKADERPMGDLTLATSGRPRVRRTRDEGNGEDAPVAGNRWRADTDRGAPSGRPTEGWRSDSPFPP